jgi:hypothetical protein
VFAGDACRAIIVVTNFAKVMRQTNPRSEISENRKKSGKIPLGNQHLVSSGPEFYPLLFRITRPLSNSPLSFEELTIGTANHSIRLRPAR